MKKVSLFRVLLLPLVCAAGASPQQAQVDGYMSRDAMGIYGVAWTEQNGQLTGSYSSCARHALTHTSDGASCPITGTHTGTHINIAVDASLMPLPVSGMLSHTTLVLKAQQRG